MKDSSNYLQLDATYLVTGEGSRELTQQATNLHNRPPSLCKLRYPDVLQTRNGYLTKWRRLVVQNACFSLNTRFWQCLTLI